MRPGLGFGALLLVASCSTAQTLTVGDGTTITHPYERGIPLPARNHLVRLVGAGPVVEQGPASDPWAVLSWAVALAAEGPPVREISLADVTPPDVRLLMRQPEPAFEQGRWGWASERVRVDRATAAWIYEPAPTTKVFRIELTDAQGMRHTLYQPVLVSEVAKRDLRVVVDNINARAGAR